LWVTSLRSLLVVHTGWLLCADWVDPSLQLSFRKLRELHGVTDENDDAQAQDFVETRLTDQVRPTLWCPLSS
jgi:hypothetical protein